MPRDRGADLPPRAALRASAAKDAGRSPQRGPRLRRRPFIQRQRENTRGLGVPRSHGGLP